MFSSFMNRVSGLGFNVFGSLILAVTAIGSLAHRIALFVYGWFQKEPAALPNYTATKKRPSVSEEEVVSEPIVQPPSMQKPVGIPNRGNTCFLASIVQAFLIDHEEDFKSYKDHLPLEKQGIASSIVTMIEGYKKAQNTGKSWDISPLVKLVWNGCYLPQQDVDEFLKRFYPFLPEVSVITTYSNQHGFQSSALEKSGAIVHLPLQSTVPLQTLLDLYFDDPQFRFMIGGHLTEKKSIRFQKTSPSQLHLSMGRFRKDGSGKTLRLIKIQDPIQGMTGTIEVPLEEGKAVYHLRSFIVHVGASIHFGHYIAYRKEFDPISKQDRFFEANDDRISEIPRGQFLKHAENAYQLFFQKVEDERGS